MRSPLHLHGGGGQSVASLINQLDDKNAKKRASAAAALGEWGAEAKLAIQRLIKSLKDPDELTSREAAVALGKIGAPGRDDLPALLASINDPKPEVRRYVCHAVGEMGPEGASAADQLVSMLGDDDERVRENAARSLGNLGPDAKSVALPALTKALEDRIKAVRVGAAVAISTLLNPPNPEDVPLLLTIVKMKDSEASVHGAAALAKLGKKAKSAVPELIDMAKNLDSAGRRGAIECLATIEPEPKQVIPVYLAAFKEGSDIGLRQSALIALGQTGKTLDKEKDKDTIASIVAVLADSIKDSDKQIKMAAMSAVGKFGDKLGTAGAKQVMPTIIEAIQSKDNAFVEQAHETIAGLGPLAKDAVNPLITMIEKRDIKVYENTKTHHVFMQDADEQFLEKITKTIGKVGAPAVLPLRRSLNTTNLSSGLVIGCCRALGEIGPPAKAALVELRFISDTAPHFIGQEADQAMRKIRK